MIVEKKVNYYLRNLANSSKFVTITRKRIMPVEKSRPMVQVECRQHHACLIYAEMQPLMLKDFETY